MFPKSFQTEYMQTESEPYDGMLSIDDKNYVLFKKGEKLIKHGSSLHGRHLPVIADKFIDSLCMTLFSGERPEDVLRTFGSTIEEFSHEDFAMTINLAKRPHDYTRNTLYFNLIQQIKHHGIRVSSGATIRYVKTANGYTPSIFLQGSSQIDYKYYKERLAELASRILACMWITPVEEDVKENRKRGRQRKKLCLKFLLGMQGTYNPQKMEQTKL